MDVEVVLADKEVAEDAADAVSSAVVEREILDEDRLKFRHIAVDRVVLTDDVGQLLTVVEPTALDEGLDIGEYLIVLEVEVTAGAGGVVVEETDDERGELPIIDEVRHAQQFLT